MILTGDEIIRARRDGQLVIEPFSIDQVNPNSYNFRLGDTLRVYDAEVLDPRHPNPYREITVGPEGYVLEAGRLYLAHTIERLGSDTYAPTFAARSSVARLGIFINLSASLGDIGFVGQWTLQLYATQRVRVYPGMPIGQMMWWKPQGTVRLYTGKYQGSVGPRSSDIHRDFLRARARQEFPRLGSTVESRDVGSKFATLSHLSAHVPVPDGFAIPYAVLNLCAGDELLGQLTAVMGDVRATVGAFIDQAGARTAELAAGYRLDETTRELLATRVAELREDHPDALLAVRSSGLTEDGADHSHAGIYRSVLNLGGVDEVIAAVEAAWRAWHELPALLSRVRAGDFSSAPRLALFVQTMVVARRAGVAFASGQSTDGEPLVQVDHVDGLGDTLVSGLASARSWRSGTELPAGPLGPDLAEVEKLARRVRALLGHDVDIEWAASAPDGGSAGGPRVWLLQARPVTAALPGARMEPAPYLAATGLYHGAAPDHDLGEVAAVYTSYVGKRAPAHRLAREHGFPTAEGLVVAFNAAGLRAATTAAPLHAFLAALPVDDVVVDLSPTVRQLIRPRAQVPGLLADHTVGRPDGTVAHAVLRPFLRGEAGVITSPLPDDGVLVEIATEGLLALNRGTAAAARVVVGSTGPVPDPGLDPAILATVDAVSARLRTVTAVMAARLGALTLEWVLFGGDLWFTDYSVPPGTGGHLVAGTTMSPGVHEGPVVDLRDRDDVLERLSIGPAVSIDKSLDVAEHGPVAELVARVAAAPGRPVVRAARPYAVLSVLLDHVGAFVFDGGSTLCHLAILLREARIPAAVAPGVVGDRLLVADGQVIDVSAQEARP